MAKVRLQWKQSEEEKQFLTKDEIAQLKYSGIVDVLQKAYAKAGWQGWYKGMQTQIVKAVLCQAILSMSKEKLDGLVVRAFKSLHAKQE